MKRLMVLVLMLSGAFAQAKLSDKQSMKCIDSDKQTKSAFQDLQAAYEMRLVTAKDFFKVIEKPASCPQLRKDLKSLHASTVSTFPRSKPSFRSQSMDDGFGASSGPAATPSHNYDAPPMPDYGDFGDFPPPPPPMSEEDFGADDFTDF